MLAVMLLAACTKSHIAITSSAFRDRDDMPLQYGCKGGGQKPPLMLSDVPSTTKSLVLIVDDPDAPSGTFTHWVVWNIPPSSTTLSGGVEGKNSAGNIGYTPPCPPSGEHHYHFKVLALDAMLNLPAGSDRAEVLRAAEGHVVGRGELVGRYRH